MYMLGLTIVQVFLNITVLFDDAIQSSEFISNLDCCAAVTISNITGFLVEEVTLKTCSYARSPPLPWVQTGGRIALPNPFFLVLFSCPHVQLKKSHCCRLA